MEIWNATEFSVALAITKMSSNALRNITYVVIVVAFPKMMLFFVNVLICEDSFVVQGSVTIYCKCCNILLGIVFQAWKLKLIFHLKY